MLATMGDSWNYKDLGPWAMRRNIKSSNNETNSLRQAFNLPSVSPTPSSVKSAVTFLRRLRTPNQTPKYPDLLRRPRSLRRQLQSRRHLYLHRHFTLFSTSRSLPPFSMERVLDARMRKLFRHLMDRLGGFGAALGIIEPHEGVVDSKGKVHTSSFCILSYNAH
jgi:hypothetical protein